MSMKSINPATGETLAEFETLSAGELESCLARAGDAVPRSSTSGNRLNMKS